MYSKFKDNRNFQRPVQKKGDESDLCELKISLVYTFSSRTPSLSQKTLCVCGGVFLLYVFLLNVQNGVLVYKCICYLQLTFMCDKSI